MNLVNGTRHTFHLVVWTLNKQIVVGCYCNNCNMIACVSFSCWPSVYCISQGSKFDKTVDDFSSLVVFLQYFIAMDNQYG